MIEKLIDELIILIKEIEQIGNEQLALFDKFREPLDDQDLVRISYVERGIQVESFLDYVPFFLSCVEENKPIVLSHCRNIIRTLVERFLVIHYFEDLNTEEQVRFFVREAVYVSAFLHRERENGKVAFLKDCEELLTNINEPIRYKIEDCASFYDEFEERVMEVKSMEMYLPDSSGARTHFPGVTKYLRGNLEKQYDTKIGATSKQLYTMYWIHSKLVHSNPHFSNSKYNEPLDLRFQVLRQVAFLVLSMIDFIDSQITSNKHEKKIDEILKKIQDLDSKLMPLWKKRNNPLK